MELSDYVKSSVTGAEIPPCEIHVDEEGDWYHKGNKIFRLEILEIFYNNLHPGSDGSFLIEWGQNRCALDVDDTPFVVRSVDRRTIEGREEIVLNLKHLSASEILDPSTLRVGEDNVLYCRVRSGRFSARFSRPAYYQLAEWIGEDVETGGFFIDIGGVRHPIEL